MAAALFTGIVVLLGAAVVIFGVFLLRGRQLGWGIFTIIVGIAIMSGAYFVGPPLAARFDFWSSPQDSLACAKAGGVWTRGVCEDITTNDN